MGFNTVLLAVVEEVDVLLPARCLVCVTEAVDVLLPPVVILGVFVEAVLLELNIDLLEDFDGGIDLVAVALVDAVFEAVIVDV